VAGSVIPIGSCCGAQSDPAVAAKMEGGVPARYAYGALSLAKSQLLKRLRKQWHLFLHPYVPVQERPSPRLKKFKRGGEEVRCTFVGSTNSTTFAPSSHHAISLAGSSSTSTRCSTAMTSSSTTSSQHQQKNRLRPPRGDVKATARNGNDAAAMAGDTAAARKWDEWPRGMGEQVAGERGRARGGNVVAKQG